jgi:hypothetical protein
MKSKKISPFEIKTTQLSQAIFYFWIPLVFALPIFVATERKVFSYLIAILLVLVVFLSFFFVSQQQTKKDSSDES